MDKQDNEAPIFSSWDELNLDTNLLRSIYSHGFEKPSPIQSKAIYPILQGRDLIAQAQSGTGKTGTFSIGALAKVNLEENVTQVIILVPTRELAEQITSVITGLSSLMNGICIKTIIGGTSIRQDAESICQTPPHIVVGCPGRICDMIKRRHLSTDQLKLVILDEADEMLSTGFREQMHHFFKFVRPEVQVALFSATLPNNIFEITDKFMRDPLRICVKAESLTLDGIKQYYVALDNDRQKYLTLKDLYQQFSVSQCIIYANDVTRVIDLYEAMKADGFPVCCLHSKMTAVERDKVFKEFRKGTSRVLISSNLTSRGIDIQQVGVVINFDLPRDVHNYLHRIGRSGRWGRKGTGINFITRHDVPKIKEIEEYYHTQIVELPGNFQV
jgi:superfamily II DNA/RNA helicase